MGKWEKVHQDLLEIQEKLRKKGVKIVKKPFSYNETIHIR